MNLHEILNFFAFLGAFVGANNKQTNKQTNKQHTICSKIFQRAGSYLWRLRLGLGRGLFCFVNLRMVILVILVINIHIIQLNLGIFLIIVIFSASSYLGKSCMLSWRQQVSMQSWVPLSNGINLEIIRFALRMFCLTITKSSYKEKFLHTSCVYWDGRRSPLWSHPLRPPPLPPSPPLRQCPPQEGHAGTLVAQTSWRPLIRFGWQTDYWTVAIINYTL